MQNLSYQTHKPMPSSFRSALLNWRAAWLCLFFSPIVASGAFITLWKDGGARPEGYSNFVEYKGVLTLVPYIWAIISLFISFVAFFRVRVTRRYLAKSTFGIIPLLAWSVASIIWSEDKLEALKALFPFLAINLLIFICFLGRGIPYLLGAFEASFKLMVIMSFVYVFFIPSYGLAQGIHEGFWQGVFSHKNNLGNTCVIIFAYFFIKTVIQKRISSFCYCWLTAVLVAMSGSSSSIICGAFVIFAGIWVALKRNGSKRVAGFFGGRMLLISFAVFALGIVLMALVIPDVQILNKDSSYSGRDKIWEYFLMRIADAPFHGHGFGQISTTNDAIVDDISSYVGFLASSTHNGFIDLIYSGGIVSLFLFMRVMFKGVSNVFDRKTLLLVLVGVFPILLINCFESRLLSFNFAYESLLMFMLWIFWNRQNESI